MATTSTKDGGDHETFLFTDERSGDDTAQGGDSGLESTTSRQVARVTHLIFAIVNPPKVSSMAREALVEWLKLRKEYEEYTKDHCIDGKEDVTAVMKSVKSSFDANVLGTLCEVCWGVEQSSVTDDFLLGKIHEITDSFQNQELPGVKELFREELCPTPTLTRDFIEGERGAKEKCKLTVCSLPKGLKSKVQNELDYRVPEAKCNIRKLYELVRVKAKDQAIEERALKKVNPPRHKHEKKEHKHGSQHNKRRNEQQDHRMVKKVNTGKDTDRRLDVQPPRERRHQGVFIVVDHTTCPNAPLPHQQSGINCSPTASKTTKAIRPTKGGTARLKRIKDCFPKHNRVVVLEDEVEVPLCIDSGADRCCLD
ncbi:hypothetical protein PR001_g22360 [Phytophthora rubi]|uniref:Uncharacterized protein n=1 Tax=Phytophthora rubi TaxID=129364 RepID=A0A6A3IN77_9STRA|nr:hypothetical protein PR002_g23234 [Phytophthora rubi]KAE8987318.1 hypothetical protein PR001_g22360 [Phytophthora rubi]